MSTPPTINRLVHYYSHGSADGKYPKTCRAAIVTEANGSEVGLAVFNPTGLFFDRTIAQDEDKSQGGTWHWPCVTITDDEVVKYQRTEREVVDTELPEA